MTFQRPSLPSPGPGVTFCPFFKTSRSCQEAEPPRSWRNLLHIEPIWGPTHHVNSNLANVVFAILLFKVLDPVLFFGDKVSENIFQVLQEQHEGRALHGDGPISTIRNRDKCADLLLLMRWHSSQPQKRRRHSARHKGSELSNPMKYEPVPTVLPSRQKSGAARTISPHQPFRHPRNVDSTDQNTENRSELPRRYRLPNPAIDHINKVWVVDQPIHTPAISDPVILHTSFGQINVETWRMSLFTEGL